MKIEKWYDVGCDICGFHLSTDFSRGLAYSAKQAEVWAREEGFRTRKGKNVCPSCLEKIKRGEISDEVFELDD